jgi:GxGYxYP putative glycoside hydrolase C-terminal domain/GxGYxY sequence motif in domain of unknown function N-terminal
MRRSRRGLTRREALARATGVAMGAAGAAAWGTSHTARPAVAAPDRARPAFPKGVRPTRLYVVDEGALTYEERVMTATLQGQVARLRPGRGGASGIYLNVPGVGYGVWLDDLATRYGVDLEAVTDVWALVDRYRARAAHADPIDTYVLYRRGEGDPSVNVATTVAGLTGALAVEETLEPTAKAHGLRLVADVRGRDDRWVKRRYWPKLSHALAVEQKPDFANQMRDYATMAGALLFYDGNSAFRRQVVRDLEPDAATMGWGDASQGENSFVAPSSEAGVRTIAADHARNLAPLSGISLDRVSQRAHGKVPAAEPGTHHVAFLITDGDNIQWMLGDFQSSERWYASPHRGTLDLGWAVSPSLVDVAPSVLRWYYDNAAAGGHQDRFVVGPSGGGYLYPSMYPRTELDLHTSRLATAMDRSDLGVVQIIDFESFDDTALWSTYLKRPEIDGLIYLEYSRYDTHKGRIVWARDKPVVSARTMLWDGLPGADEASVTTELNAAGRDPSTADGYSIVMWHAWSKSVENVKAVVDNLAPHVKVVTPDVLVRLVARNVRH